MSTADDTFTIKLDEYDGSDEIEDPDLTGSTRREPQSALRAGAKKTVSKWAKAQKKRDFLGDKALYLASHRTNIGYTQYRPVNISRPLTVVAHDRVQLDCSSMVEWLYCRCNAAFKKWGGVPDPGGFGYSGYGNTYSQEARGSRIEVPKKGDLAFYNGHVAIVVRSNPQNPRASIVVSHGSESGPLILRADYRSDLHRGFRRYF